MGVLGYQNVVPPEAGRLIYAGPDRHLHRRPAAITAKPATVSNGATLGSRRRTTRPSTPGTLAGLAAGGAAKASPGPRERAPNNSRGAYLRDPDGNKVCAFHMQH